jgi:integration host factor subunit beta
MALSQISYAANSGQQEDVVVRGRLSDQSYQHVDDPDDILGHGWITARLHVSRVVRGRSVRPNAVLTVKYFAHTYMREDRTARFHLRPTNGGSYVVCAAVPADGVSCN